MGERLAKRHLDVLDVSDEPYPYRVTTLVAEVRRLRLEAEDASWAAVIMGWSD